MLRLVTPYRTFIRPGFAYLWIRLLVHSDLLFILRTRKYEGESIIIRNAVAFVFLLATLSFSRASLGMVFYLSQLCTFEVARSVPL